MPKKTGKTCGNWPIAIDKPPGKAEGEERYMSPHPHKQRRFLYSTRRFPGLRANMAKVSEAMDPQRDMCRNET
jgi:hypothetical protein